MSVYGEDEGAISHEEKALFHPTTTQSSTPDKIEVTQAERSENVGHGHVFLRPDGARARCGGPRACGTCAGDLALLRQRMELPALRSQADEVERLLREAREDMAMCVAEISKARGRLETLAGCNEDRRIAAALGSTCDHLRRRWFEPETRIDAALKGDNHGKG